MKHCLGSTEEEVAAEFSKAQLKTLQVKLKEQETSLKDLKFQNSVLLERIAVLEKPQKQALYNSYFPNHDQNGADSHVCPNQAHRCSHQTHSCAHHSYSCNSMPSCTSCHCSQSSYTLIQQQLDSISSKLDTFLISEKQPPSVATHLAGSCSQPKSSGKSSNYAVDPQIPETAENSNSNESIISIDNCMPDDEQVISLNSMVMTSRSHQPMLLE